ncbi:MAG: ABC transporter permease [Chloroflexi bacterium]|nr:ABC transporter permease [Chloroflexota bacterium]
MRGYTRTRGLALAYGVGALILVAFILNTEPGIRAAFTYTASDGQEKAWVTVPVLPFLVGSALLLLGLGMYQWRRGDRPMPYAAGILGTVVGLAFIVWITRGKSLNTPGILQSTLVAATPLTLGVLSGIFSERSGIINIAIEGMMLTGALAAAAFFALTGSPWWGLVAAMVFGGLMAALHAVLSIRYKVDQIISGTAINILAMGLTRYLNLRILDPANLSSPGTFAPIRIPVLADIPIIGPILFDNQPTIYIALLLVPLAHIVLYHTVWGLHTRAAGEHPRAADTLGIDVFFLRYVNVIIGGMLAGIGGAYFSIGEVGSFEDNMTNGRGFMALAAMIFGNWNPFGGFAASLLFGFADAIQVKMQILKVAVPPEFLQSIPYVLTIVVLAGLVGQVMPPAAEGRPYERE